MGRPRSDRRDSSPRAVEARHLFNFLRPDGSRYIGQLYWEGLYAFLPHGREVLAAARVVPHADELFAMYIALKYGNRLVHREMLPPLPRGEGSAGLVRVVDEIAPSRQPALPADVREQAALTVQMAITQAIADHRAALPEVLLTEGASPVGEPAGWTRPKPGTLFATISLDPEDVAKVAVSSQIHTAIRSRTASLREELEEAVPEDEAIALRDALGDDLDRRLYSHPQYLRFVEWVMDAAGGLASPVVTDFLRYYYRCVGEKAQELFGRGEFQYAFWKERFHSLLGRAEADAFGTLPFHEITVLGYLHEGELPVFAADPEHTGKSYRVDPHADLSGLVLSEVQGVVQRSAMKLFIASHFRSNINAVRYLDEGRRPQRPAQKS